MKIAVRAMSQRAKRGRELWMAHPAPFLIDRPEASAGPFVFASPHSGDVYPDDMGADPDLSPRSLNSACDVEVDRLIEDASRLGAPVLKAVIGRAYVDLNRAPEDQDPVLVEGLDGIEAGPRVRAGYGVVPRLAGDGSPLYARRLSLEEAEARVARYHAPYHAALEGLMREAHARNGRAILADWHSMPALAPKGGADVVIGDRHGRSCSSSLTRLLRARFEALGWRVALNHPYAGGYTTQVWGRPVEGFHAIQIEISRALYWDAAKGQPSAAWDRRRREIGQVIAALLASGL